MTSSHLLRWRTRVGRISALCGLLVFAALLDGIVAQFRQPTNVLDVLPGSTVEMNGGLPEDLKGVQDLSYLSDSPHLQLTFTDIHRGYWLGGSMWRGRLTVGPEAPPGKGILSVGSRATLTAKPYMIYRVNIYPDPDALRQSSRSLVERYLGRSPWAVALFFAAWLGLGFGLVFLLSQKMENLLALGGKAEIFLVTRGEGQCDIAFGLGARHGIHPGMRLQILNEQGRLVATAEVREVSESDAIAMVSEGEDIKPGYIVSRF